jgi:hypothetical protein
VLLLLPPRGPGSGSTACRATMLNPLTCASVLANRKWRVRERTCFCGPVNGNKRPRDHHWTLGHMATMWRPRRPDPRPSVPSFFAAALLLLECSILRCSATLVGRPTSTTKGVGDQPTGHSPFPRLCVSCLCARSALPACACVRTRRALCMLLALLAHAMSTDALRCVGLGGSDTHSPFPRLCVSCLCPTLLPSDV